ncbi:hypothetical protein AA0X95_07150 [Bacillus sp. 1P10SD]
MNEWSTVSGIEAKVSILMADGYFTPSEEVQLFGIVQEGLPMR